MVGEKCSGVKKEQQKIRFYFMLILKLFQMQNNNSNNNKQKNKPKQKLNQTPALLINKFFPPRNFQNI